MKTKIYLSEGVRSPSDRRLLVIVSKTYFLPLCVLLSLSGRAQVPTFDCYLANDAFISPTIYQFDLYLLRTGTNVFEYAAGQFGILINSAAANGGTLTPAFVAGSCQLSTMGECPSNPSLYTTTYCFNIPG